MKFKLFIKKYYPALLVFVILVAFSYQAYEGARIASYDRRSKLFDARVQRLSEDVKSGMSNYIQILKGCQAFFYASDTVSENDFKIYTNNLKVSENYPGIQAMAYAPYISNKKHAALESKIQRIKKDFKIQSTFTNKILTPIVFIEPLNERNKRAVGYDLYSDSIRRAAIRRAIVTGEASITKKIKLVQETSKNVQPGFLIFLPIYKNGRSIRTPEDRLQNVTGLVSNVFRAHDLMSVLFERYSDFNIEIYDGKQDLKEQLLYNSDSLKTNDFFAFNKKSDFKAKLNISIAGNPWGIFVTPNNQFGSVLERQQPALIFIFGISISVLLSLLIFNIIKRQSEIAEELLLSKSLESKKDEFIGIASHELKTPLTSIKAYMQLLERADLNEREKNFIQKANSNVNKLSNLIGDLLDVSKVQAGRLQLNNATFSVISMIDESIENVQHMYSTHQIIKKDSIPDVELYGDILRLEQAMTNLLVNAIKYSPGASSIYVNAVVLSDEVRIEVIDQGLGISKENQEKVFDRFFRAEELSPVISGLGMGLYISNEIVKRHQGKMGVKSRINEGSTFCITLPLKHTNN
ncbi:CHASE domain-containing sensor histidine kinase [Daejeonella oryzae]|uniref:CHASE domain-containing sensor histidine kinase n=1 Tax=Daejeonella oryzae TaxID=1122943 RepID=UPI000405DB65|nr:CHASE domain-containing protein [Daejeonella oryzae]